MMMVNFSDSHLMANSTGKILNVEVEKPYVTLDAGLLITILINSITCPFTVLLNVCRRLKCNNRP